MNGADSEVPHCGAISTFHCHPSWAQIFASGCSKVIYNSYVMETAIALRRDHAIPLALIIYMDDCIISSRLHGYT